MSINEIKQTIENNLNQQKDLLKNLPISSEAITNFFLDLTKSITIGSSNTSITMPDSDSVQVDISFGKPWKVKGVAAGQINDAHATITFQDNNGTTDATLEMSGTFAIPKLNRSLPVTGTISNPEGWVLDLNVDAGNLPGLNDLLAMNGLGSVTRNLNSMGLSLPKVDSLWFGYDFSTKSFSYAGVKTSMKVGAATLDATCTLDPDLVISAGLSEGSSLGLKDLLQTLKFSSDAIPSIALSSLDMTIHPAAKSFSAAAEVKGDWSLGKIGSSEFVVEGANVEFSKQPGSTSMEIKGTAHVFSSDLEVSAVLDNDLQLTGSATNINLTSVVEAFLGDIIFPSEIPNVVLDTVDLSILPKTKEVSFTSTSTEDWTIPLGVTGLKIEDVSLSFDRKAGATRNKFVTTGQFSGNASIATVFCPEVSLSL